MTRLNRAGVLTFVAVAALLLAAGAHAGNGKAPKRILLEEGARPGYRWGMLAYRDKGAEGGKHPCLLTIIYFKSSWGLSESDDTFCGPLPRGGPPVMLSYSFGSGEKEVTIFALAFERRVASIRLNLGEAGTRTIHLKILNERQTENAALRPFRFRTFSVGGPSCLTEVTGYAENGREIYRDQSPGECPRPSQ
jgi:hypothetical protein